MHLDYIDDLPFEYLISDVNKDIKLSDKIKDDSNHYYINISNSSLIFWRHFLRLTRDWGGLKLWT